MKNKQVLKLKYLTCIKHLNSTIKAPNYRVFLASKLEKSVYLKKVHWSVTVIHKFFLACWRQVSPMEPYIKHDKVFCFCMSQDFY